jgi:hypothetical protein
MSSGVLKLTAANSVNLTKVKDAAAKLTGCELLNTTAAAVFIKFYWFIPSDAVPQPVVGTTVPDITIEIPALGTATGSDGRDWTNGLIKNQGALYFAITNLAADADATVVAAGSAIVSIFFE